MRIALLTYRGNMYCGGQGIYAANIARELHQLGHEVHVVSGPPLPELDPGIPLHALPNLSSYGISVRRALRVERPLRALAPGHLWELAQTRLGTFPEIAAFTVRVLFRWKELMRECPFDVVLDNQSLGWGLLGLQASGVPVVGLIHHPLHIDRAADFALESSFKYRWKRTVYRPLGMQEFVARRLSHVMTVSQASAEEIERYFRVPQQADLGRSQRHRYGVFPAAPAPAGDRSDLCGPHRGPQEGGRRSARGPRPDTAADHA